MDPRLRRYIGKLAGTFMAIEGPAVLLLVVASIYPDTVAPYDIGLFRINLPYLAVGVVSYVFPVFYIPLAIMRIVRKYKSLKIEG
ncbi:hypothetical protein HYZ80_03170 [Candidatus Parcubacteria bacterium]|nr:hypothetical protein [Candidatus Parcubacteria bacterium]